MSDQNEPPRDGDEPTEGASEPVGSVGEEAAKLFAALSDVAKERGSDLGETATHFSEALRGAGDHIGHGEDCRYCPVCQAIRVVRETSPEVKAHLAVAASSLMQAAAGVLATHLPDDKQAGSPVERIDLDDTDDWGDDA